MQKQEIHSDVADKGSGDLLAMAELHASEQRFRATFEQAAVGLAHVGLDGRWLLANGRLCELVGYSHDELLKRTFTDITHPDDREADVRSMRALLAGTLPSYVQERRYIHKKGSPVWVNSTISLIRDARGAPAYFVVTVENISGGKRVEGAPGQPLQEVDRRTQELEATFEAMADAVAVYDRDGCILHTNGVHRALFLGNDPERFHLEPNTDCKQRWIPCDVDGQPLPHDRWPAVRVLRGEVLRGENAVDIVLRLLNGRSLQLNVGGAPVRAASGEIVGGVLVYREVTERRRYERRRQETLDALLGMAEGLVGDDYQPWSDAVGSTPGDRATGQRLVELMRGVLGCRRVSMVTVHPETQALEPVAIVGFRPALEQHWWDQIPGSDLDDYLQPSHLSQLQADGVLIVDAAQLKERAALNEGRTLLIVAMRLAGQLYGFLTVDYGTVPHVYQADEIALARTVARLATLLLERARLQREHAQARAAELALREANRRMDEFLSIVGHEVRTPLTTIMGNVQLAQLQASVEEVRGVDLAVRLDLIRRLLGRADDQIGRLTRLIRDLLDLSRIRAGQLELRRAPCDLVRLVEEAVEDQRQVWPGRKIALEIRATPVRVLADADRLMQVVVNYLTNALKFSAQERPVAVQLRVEGKQARVQVRDEGPGLSPDEQTQIWDRFRRVDGMNVRSGSYVGLGLGLYISKTFVERHGGQVGVESAPGAGSTFWFTLQVLPDPAGEPAGV